MTLEEFKKRPPALNPGIPTVFWNCSGATRKGDVGITADELEAKLAKGMPNDEIDKLIETKKGENCVDNYLKKKHAEGKHVERMTGGDYNHRLPNGNFCRNTQFDPKTGKPVEL
jgi:hypothetical protein